MGAPTPFSVSVSWLCQSAQHRATFAIDQHYSTATWRNDSGTEHQVSQAHSEPIFVIFGIAEMVRKLSKAETAHLATCGLGSLASVSCYLHIFRAVDTALAQTLYLVTDTPLARPGEKSKPQSFEVALCQFSQGAPCVVASDWVGDLASDVSSESLLVSARLIENGDY